MKKDVSSRSRWLCRTAMFIGIAALAAQVNASVVMNGTRFVSSSS
jgi:P pilus assembly chaperone PapD